ncbi:MAG: OprO/OprP family phosphate-selective porin [Polaromonas sp.]
MRVMSIAVLAALGSVCVASPVQAKSSLLELLAQKGIITAEEYAELKAEQKSEPIVATDDGFRLSTRDSSSSAPPTFQVGTLQQLDVANYQDDGVRLSDGSELRRSRLSVAGSFLTDWQYRVEYEFSGTTGVTDVYVSYNALKPVVITAGQFKQPFGMEAYASDKNLTFMERGLPFAFVITRAPGIAVGTSGANWSLNGGVFGEPVGNVQAGNDGYGAAARASYAPIVSDDAVLHLGLGATWRTPTEDNSSNATGARFSTVRLRSKPESNILAQRFVDTGEIRDVDSYTTAGLELAGALGAASLQGEYQATRVARDNGADLDFGGWYAQAAYTLTGEARPYRADRGYFDGIKPARNFGNDGWGAFEIALRLSGLDLTDGSVLGGRERNASAAFNWYLNQYLRVSANVIKVLEVDGGAFDGEEPTVFQARLQLAY